MINVNVNINLDANEIQGAVDQATKKVQFALDQQILKDSNFFIPTDTRNLRNSSLLHSLIGEGMLTWWTPYAARLYYNPDYKFSKDQNPNAQGLWFEMAKSLFLSEWVALAQQKYDENM